MNYFTTYESIALSTKGYSDRWNMQRATKALGWLTPAQTIEQSYINVLALMIFIKKDSDIAVYKLDQHGDAVMTVPKPEKQAQKKNKTRKVSTVDKYLSYLEWADQNKLKCLILGNPTISQNFSKLFE